MQVFLLVLAAWIFSVCLHEFGHAIVAYHGGDTTVEEKGYLTMNPVHYTHPIYSLLMPVLFLCLGGFGLPGGAVYINDHLLRSRAWRTWVSLAGPSMNLVLVLLLLLPFWFGLVHQTETDRFAPALAFLIRLQISAVLFNLLPVPPLDGFRAVGPWLPGGAQDRIMEHANVFFFTLILVMWYVPAANQAFWGATDICCAWLGVDPELADVGYYQFRFWSHPG
jgi:Zn-dependent protease